MRFLLMILMVFCFVVACDDTTESAIEGEEETTEEVGSSESEENVEDEVEEVSEESEETETTEESESESVEETETTEEDETSTEEEEVEEVEETDPHAIHIDDFPDRMPSNETRMTFLETVTEGPSTPKSIMSNKRGLLIANNMMYTQSVTLYDSETHDLELSLSDAVNLHEYGFTEYPDQLVNGSPVEAVWTDDGQYAYVSNYAVMDFGAYADDACTNGTAINPAFIYRFSVEEMDWDQVIQAGRVPKYVAITPDQTKLLVSNWCDHDISVIDLETGDTLHRVPININPRGIVILPDNKTAYVTAQWAHELYRVDIENGTSEKVMDIGIMPRHLVLSPEGDVMYLTVSRENWLVKIDTETAEIIDSTYTGLEPRTMDISPDGTALYIVNYDEATVSKYDADTLEELQREPVGYSPIGVTYDLLTGKVWVANYGGSFTVFDDLGAEADDAGEGVEAEDAGDGVEGEGGFEGESSDE